MGNMKLAHKIKYILCVGKNYFFKFSTLPLHEITDLSTPLFG